MKRKKRRREGKAAATTTTVGCLPPPPPPPLPPPRAVSLTRTHRDLTALGYRPAERSSHHTSTTFTWKLWFVDAKKGEITQTM
jgi:hypothetical protein